MTHKELVEKYNSRGGVCAKCGMTLLTTGNALGEYFVMDRDGKFYCADCDEEFEDGDERIFTPDEECFEDCTLDELLDKLSGILDQAYEFSEDESEREYICAVEDALHSCLKKMGVIK